MKTTLNLDDHLLRDAKRLAAERGTTLTRVVEDALRDALRTPDPPNREALRLPTVRGRARPSVDVSDRDALYERMEERR